MSVSTAVYAVSSGCLFEGGSVKSVFASEETAIAFVEGQTAAEYEDDKRLWKEYGGDESEIAAWVRQSDPCGAIAEWRRDHDYWVVVAWKVQP